MTLCEYLRQIYVPSRLQISAGTIEQMEVCIRRLETQLNREALVSELSEELILSHLQWLIAEKNSPATINNRRGYLLTLWRHAYRKRGPDRRQYCENDPHQADIPTMTLTKSKPRAWPIDSVNRMLDQAMKVKERFGFGPKHWTALISLLYYTGLRITATLELKRSDLHGHILIVPPTFQKDREEMVIKLPGHLTNLLVALPRPVVTRNKRLMSEYLIPWPWSLDHVQDRLRDYILIPAGLPNDPKLKFHAFRRTTATVMAAIEGKEAAMNALGHSSIKMTERYLADILLVAPELDNRVQPADVMPALTPRLIG